MSRDEPARPSLGAIASQWTVALCALAGLIIGMVIFVARPSVYESRTLVSVPSPLGSMGDEAALVESDRVFGTSIAALGFEPELEVEANEVANLLTLTVRAGDPDDAALAATQLAEIYIRTQTSVAASVASPATANTSPVAPSRMAHILLGSGLGALVGAAIMLARGVGERMPRRTPAAERPEPIRPARKPSEHSSQLAAAAGGDVDAVGERRAVGEATNVAPLEPAPVVRAAARPRPTPRPTHATAAPDAVGPAETLSSNTSVTTPGAAESGAFAGALTTSGHRSPDLTETTPGPATVTDDSRAVLADVEPAASMWGDGSERPEPPTSSDDEAIAASPDDTPLFEAEIDDAPIGPATVRSDEAASDAAPLPVGEPVAVAHAASEAVGADGPTARPDEDVMVSAEEITQAVETALASADTRLEARLAEQRASDAEKLASIENHYERQVEELKREVAEARKQARGAIARLKRMDGDDQHRIGDLEAQTNALEAEITSLRTQLETERIGHLREIAGERDAADVALDNARREFREQLAAHESTSRSALARSRSDLDEVLAELRADHELALDRQHREYEEALAAERDRRTRDLAKLTERHREEIVAVSGRTSEVEAQIKRQTKETLAELRHAEKTLSEEVDTLRTAERTYRDELVQLRARLRQDERASAEAEQVLRDELTTTRKALQTEKDRNAALREDVVRRTAEAHQAVDRAIDERTAQLGELEALMARQRDQAEQRIREANEAAQSRLNEAAERELELQARISRLERQLDQRLLDQSSQTG